ncbi:DUF732 domain-containing protein [Mycobacterium sp. IS-1556]|uniref:DUF732 domain-containing protein n=1 Tax=Mycobacterium sp. IS-1556 TaxID=1772276 RepID=UPI0009EBE2F6|nr:DUF732 domain-containing protein [Mycobacterium sp. IS-1556]
MVTTYRGLIVPVAALSTFAVISAAPAQADEATYLKELLPSYTHLTAAQLLAEGYRVCQAERSGTNSPEAVKMVYRDLGVSLTAAGDIVRAAVVHLGC